jgi:hypothetical protein
MKALIIIALVVLLVVFGPLATIWAMNTLFPALAIPYNLETWVAVVLLSSVLKSTVKVGK